MTGHQTPAADIALVAAGGILGALARYGLECLLAPNGPGFPTGTLLINVIGCLVIGMIAPLLVGAHARWRPFLVTGLLGGFTTFSAFALESVLLLDAGRVALAAVYVIATLALGLLAVPIGAALTRRWVRT